tara:strand:+ start:1091 stop:1723 length:633 start_codon:yes stop_codon:yes gene_type:complete
MMDQEKQIALEEFMQGVESWSPADVLYFGPLRRAVSLYGPVTRETVFPIISQVLELEQRDPGKPIRLHINTEGGSLSDALALYDALRGVSGPIVTVATGMCASAGLLLLSAGDLRLATKNTLFFYHEPILPLDEIISKKQLDETVKAYDLCKMTYERIIKEKTNMSDEIWNKEFDGETSKYFDVSKALEYNFVDDIVQEAEKVLKIKAQE